MASRLARRLGVPHVELDALFWEPNWTEATDEVFRERVRAATAGDGWVACGNYSRVQDLLLPRADTVVWMDPELRVILRRAITRTIRRSILRTNLWGTGNREQLRNLFKGPQDSLYKWAKRTHADRTARYEAMMGDPTFAHLDFVRLRSPRAARAWLRGVERASSAMSPR